jgi:hypothetical protein
MWTACNKLFKRPYWSRLWIFQEVVLARRCFLMCGTHLCLWNWAATTALALGAMPHKPEFLGTTIWLAATSGVGWTCMNKITTAQLNCQQNGRAPVPLFAAFLYMTHGLFASDARDHVYAILGISDVGLVVDYTKSVNTVYTDAALLCMKESMIVSILHTAGIGAIWDQNDNSLLPSWVPDWHAASKQEYYDSAAFPSFEHFNAGGQGCEHLLAISEPNMTLCCTGIATDLPLRICPAYRFREEIQDHQILTDLCTLTAHRGYPTGVPRLQVMIRVLLGDIQQAERMVPGSFLFQDIAAGFFYHVSMQYAASKVNGGDITEREAVSHFRDLIDSPEDMAYDKFLLDQLLKSPGYPHSPRWESLNELMDRGKETRAKYLQQSIKPFKNRRIFYTAKGYMGTGPIGMRETDTIWVLRGCNVPVVLRKVSSRWRLVGTCFILGIMDGEVMGAVDRGDKTLESIEIW